MSLKERVSPHWELQQLERRIKQRTLELNLLEQAERASDLDWLPIECCPDNVWVEVMGWLTMEQSSIADTDGMPWVAYVRKIDLRHPPYGGFKSDYTWQLGTGDYLEHENKHPEFWRPARALPAYPRPRNWRWR